MGLGMYLTKKIYVGANYEHNKVSGNIEIFQGGKKLNIELKNISYILEQVGYWRKANQIHKWFVDNVQDGNDNCESYYVSHEKLEELLNLCNVVLADNSKAVELLPTESGFFFGGVDYDEYYFRDLQHTKEVIENILSDEDCEFEYQSSW